MPVPCTPICHVRDADAVFSEPLKLQPNIPVSYTTFSQFHYMNKLSKKLTLAEYYSLCSEIIYLKQQALITCLSHQ